MKGYDYPPAPGHQRTFNAAMVKARRIVEVAFGKAKGRFHILMNNFLHDPVFAADVAVLCCALNNVCERAKCPYTDSRLAEELSNVRALPAAAEDVNGNANPLDGAGLIRYAIAQHLHGTAPIP